MAVVIDWLIISVIHSHISFAILFSVIALRLSWPQLYDGVNLDRWCIVVALCSKLKVDSYILYVPRHHVVKTMTVNSCYKV